MRITIKNGRKYVVCKGLRVFWSRQMEDDLRRLFPRTFNAEIAEYLGVSQSAMSRKAREMGLRKDPEWLVRIRDERMTWANWASNHNGNAGRIKKGEHKSKDTQFKKGRRNTQEQEEKRREGMRRWARDNPEKARQRAMKAAESRRRNRMMRLDFRPDNCGTCTHCRYDLDRRICFCAKSGEDIGKNQYCYTCDGWEKETSE